MLAQTSRPFCIRAKDEQRAHKFLEAAEERENKKKRKGLPAEN